MAFNEEKIDREIESLYEKRMLENEALKKIMLHLESGNLNAPRKSARKQSWMSMIKELFKLRLV